MKKIPIILIAAVGIFAILNLIFGFWQAEESRKEEIIETKTWETFTNQDWNWQIDYPAEWIYDIRSSNVVRWEYDKLTFHVNSLENVHVNQPKLNTIQDMPDLVYDAITDEGTNYYKQIFSQEFTKVDNLDSYNVLFVDYRDNLKDQYTFIKDDNLFVLEFSLMPDQEVSQQLERNKYIISTFKFLD